MKIIRKTAILFLSAALAAALAACGSEQPVRDSQSESEVREVIIGIGADFPPLSFYDDNNELTGFEKDMFDAIDERLPQYALTYRTFDFTNILMSFGRIS